MTGKIVVATKQIDFVGQNIKGTPPMKRERVEHDLQVLMEKADIVAAQEFRWDWYWRGFKEQAKQQVNGKGEVTREAWTSSPTPDDGIKAPVRGAQPIFWEKGRFARERVKVSLLHEGAKKISEDRFLRAVLLRDKESGLKFWVLSTHFVVKGDEAGDEKRRRDMMAVDLKHFDAFVAALVKTGHPVIGQLDANIHKGTQAYGTFMRILKAHGARVHGVHGVEYLFTIHGKVQRGAQVKVEVKRDWQISTSHLFTDHEGRAITFRLVKRKAA